MSKGKRKAIELVGDFETTVYDGQKETEVWASALVPLYSENVIILHSIDETLNYLISLGRNCIVYYHNLKFDGAFWLDYLLRMGYKNALTLAGFKDKKELKNGEMGYIISDSGQWYKLYFKAKDHVIELRDSYKLLPFAVKKIGKDFKTRHQKLDMKYEGKRFAGCTITDKEKEYIANDVLVVKEALEIMISEGHDKLTIGSCCLSEYKQIAKHELSDWDSVFPDLYKVKIDRGLYGSSNADEYIRKSYKGGWCYVAKGKEKKAYSHGTTADVNSLYPSMMWSKSGNRYPYGLPHFWQGNIPEEALRKQRYYFVRIRCMFHVKQNYLPFIQKKGSPFYSGAEMLETSDFLYKGKHYNALMKADGTIEKAVMELTLTCTDWILFQEHYNITELEVLDGCWFESMTGLFDTYIDKYRKIKMESTGALRTIAKLFLNNLYGKMSASKVSDYKVARINESGDICYETVKANDKAPGYIPVGSAITSYARNFTIRAAQANYYGSDKPGFIYADTDSIHCDLYPEEMKGIKVDDVAFCCWKLETCWDYGWFVRQKTYIEHVTEENLKQIEKPYYNVKCAGLPARCKELFLHSVLQDYTEGQEGLNTYNQEEIAFMKEKRELESFQEGIRIPGKLMPKRVEGGIILASTYFEMR